MPVLGAVQGSGIQGSIGKGAGVHGIGFGSWDKCFNLLYSSLASFNVNSKVVSLIFILIVVVTFILVIS